MELIEEESVCSVASKRGKYRQEVRVGRQTTRSVPFIIIPMKEGQRSIEVKAAVKDSSLNDGVMKMLRVVVRETKSLSQLTGYIPAWSSFSFGPKEVNLLAFVLDSKGTQG